MHGRLKVRTTEEQNLIKRKEQQKKVAAYRLGMQKILGSRKLDSYDPESLAICAQLLTVNPDIYTLWNYRKEVVLLKLDQSKQNQDEEEQLINFMENELDLTKQCLRANPKSYGSWHHRYWILEQHSKPNWQKEFDLCTEYLTHDDRNFHCWDYRRLILKKVDIPLIEELIFSTNRININFSNYSSWHYRSTIHDLTSETVEAELKIIQDALFTDPEDSSAWFYLRWVLNHPSVTMNHKEDLLANLEQLLELEPDCKWVLRAQCWLMESLCKDDGIIQDTRVKLYEKLQTIDSMRKGQYLDYENLIKSKSKEVSLGVVENA